MYPKFVIMHISILDDFVEFENDQANQNCHGKRFHSKDDREVSTNSLNEMIDPLGIALSTRHSDKCNTEDEVSNIAQSLLNKDGCEQNLCLKENEFQTDKSFKE